MKVDRKIGINTAEEEKAEAETFNHNFKEVLWDRDLWSELQGKFGHTGVFYFCITITMDRFWLGDSDGLTLN